MNNEEIRKKEEIESALAAMIDGDFLEASKDLLAVLCYRSERTAELPGTADDFIQRFPARNRNTETEAEFVDSAESIKLVFQVRSEEIAPNDQPTLFESSAFDEGYVKSFMFFAIELADKDYPRGKYAQFTREINKRFMMPIVVFFRVENRLTIGFVGRRQHMRDPDRDVLEQVSLIKDIRLDKPHPAHRDILFELWLKECAKWMTSNNQPENFDGLLAAWLARLDTSELNKRFFNELANWYFWAVDQVTFPDDAGEDVEVRNATSVIRLLTRLIFVWFIKEKGLVPDTLFNSNDLEGILNNLDPQASTYYKAILQNLFFATLNQEMNTPQRPNNRKFRGEGRQHYNITSVYRYKDYFIDPDEALRKFETIPFLNGGLFECLDAPSKEDARRILRVDGFSDRDDNPLHVPNELFFLDERIVNLNAAYGTRGKQHKVRGLVHILSSYKFTVAENTPIEEEVALDPELLGKVFENLLAAYNPETKVTARKQTGSYYTPREIVNYMTDESLVAYLKNELIAHFEAQNTFSVTTPPSQLDFTKKADPVQRELGVETVSLSDEQKAKIEKKVRVLLSYSDKPHQFGGTETEVLINAIDTLKILDPAVGSGAYPMGVLHRLVFILRKLDPRNEQWKQRQIDRVEDTIERAEEIDDSTFRQNTIRDLEQEIENIKQAFERNELDYGRKLYLIENCIYGVDIQPIATQIAKLRFFISLIVDQQIDDSEENRGVRPLPNLETKFVAANTLLGVKRPLQTQIRNPQIDREEKRLEEVRRRHFTARTPKTKAKYRALDAQIRAEISELLQGECLVSETAFPMRQCFPHETTEKIAHWDPYDQNTSADFFDPEWMFGVRDGFDVVIGNPPYISHDRIPEQLRTEIRNHYQSYQPFADLYCYFIEKAMELQNQQGILSFITSNSYLRAEYGVLIRRLLRTRNRLLRVINIEDSQVFESAIVNIAIIVSCQPTNFTDDSCIVVNSSFSGNSFEDFVQSNGFNCLQAYFNSRSWNLVEPRLAEFQRRLESSGRTLEQLQTKIRLGIATGSNEAFLIDENKKRELCERNPVNAEIIKPILRGRDISRYSYTLAGEYILLTKNGINVQRDYPDIYEHLESFGDRFRNRGAQGQHWTNLRACSFYDDFQKEKIVWIELTDMGRFALCSEEIYLLNSAYFLLPPSGIESKFLLGILNSSTIRFYLGLIAETSGMGTSRWINNYVKEFPIPEATCEQQALIIELVGQILAAKHISLDANVCELENEIDQIVYSLYDLTPDEIAIVEEAENV